MVEYALLLASSATRSFAAFAGNIGAWTTTVNWTAVGYVVLALVALRIVVKAFRRSEY
jgi:hypothetical protein